MRQVTVIFCLLLLYIAGNPAHSAANMSMEPNNCSGSWQLWYATYTYTAADRRNYYWIQRLEKPQLFVPFKNIAGPFAADTHCVPIGFGNHDTFRSVGCTNNDYRGGNSTFGEFSNCDYASVTNEIMIPKRSCQANY